MTTQRLSPRPAYLTPPGAWLLMLCCLAGCGPDQATRLRAGTMSPPQASDTVDPGRLQAGLATMRERVVATEQAYAKIEPQADFRYFLHPTMTKDAAIVFDLDGLDHLVLSPHIYPLDNACARDQQAARVLFTYQLDARPPVSFSVDRNWDRTLPVALAGARRLRASVNQGNGAITCDWFGLGLLDVR